MRPSSTGATWSPPQQIPVAKVGAMCAVQQFGNEVWLLGVNGPDNLTLGPAIAAFDGRSRRVIETKLPLPQSQLASQRARAATLGSYVLLCLTDDDGKSRFFLLNRTPPGTTFALAPAPGKRSKQIGGPHGRPRAAARLHRLSAGDRYLDLREPAGVHPAIVPGRTPAGPAKAIPAKRSRWKKRWCWCR